MKKVILSALFAAFTLIFTMHIGTELLSSSSTLSMDSYYLSSNIELAKNDETIFTNPFVKMNGVNSVKPLFISSDANGSNVAVNVDTSEMYETLHDAINAATTDDTIKLLTDVVETTTVNITNKTINLDLNDHELSWNNSVNMFIIGTGGTLNLFDNGTTVTKFRQSEGDEYSRYWVKDSNGDKTVTGGYILGGINLNANSLIQVNGGTFNMHGGTIVGTRNINTGWSTAGIWIQTGTFNMYGGAFKGCNARDGVIESSGDISTTIKIYDDAIIENCISFNCAGALFLRGNTDFYMYGGTIKDCYAYDHGGAINAKGENCKMYLYGGKIVNNKSRIFGGGISIEDNNVHIETGGDVYIMDNSLTNGQADNLYFYSNNSIYLGTGDNIPKEGMHIGISTKTTPTASTPVMITTGGASTDTDYFTSDNPVYAVQYVSDHLELVKSWTALQNALNGTTTQTIEGLFEINNGTIKLSTDFKADTGDTTLTVSGTKILDLNGYVINYASISNNSVINVPKNTSLSLFDSGTTEHYFTVDDDGLWTLTNTKTETTKTVKGGVITGGNASTGGGIYIGGTFIMNSGTIVGNSANDGGAVYVAAAGGNFELIDGTICGNKANNNGGGVNVQGMFTMQGGVIEYNKVATDNSFWGGGGVIIFNEAEGTFSGGKIQYNITTNHGGGVLILQSGYSTKPQNVTMTGVSIINNAAEKGGGGVFFDDSQVTVSLGGNTKVKDNESGELENNFQFSDRGINLKLVGEVNSRKNMIVGVTTYTLPTDTTHVKITMDGVAEDTKCLTSDNTDYTVIFNTDHLELAKSIAYNSTKNKGYITLAEAISEAVSGDEIELWASENTENIVLPDGVILYAKSGYTGTVTTNLTGKTIVKQDMLGEYQFKFFVTDVHPEDYTYKFLEGDNQELTIDNIDSFTFTIDGDYSLFESVEIGDLELIEDEDYIVTEGSTIITFTNKGIAKLNTLDKGTYDILVTYSNGKNVTGSLFLDKILPQNPDAPNPKTGDHIIYYILIGITSLLGLIGSAFYVRKKLY